MLNDLWLDVGNLNEFKKLEKFGLKNYSLELNLINGKRVICVIPARGGSKSTS